MDTAIIIKSRRTGFTLIEILIVIGLIAILATVVLVSLNPARQFAQARDAQRTSNVSAILNAIGQNIVDNKGIFTCPGQTIDNNARTIQHPASGANQIDLRPCLVPTYIAEIPVDPKTGSAYDSVTTNYNTGYTVATTTGNRVIVSAPATEIASPAISVTR